ncbi:uncharacterized protein BO80DRAFT_427322 [Aspergillus ibericus CBS 121593]|uniref:Arrestin-like N-terminal domain-containing protein n=1 Tax=Aspergillus ibericus CBS 121593 TaxID=1448316 RepID=A0A395GSI7_9EURO|nr:hypothetical protein BO80DRAFT_427322 [Aspergillus ibericus CBS 121593]RAK98495.1 hypothetical protein BO80DRAFT_427322 [Aspergillus ibericus CBS 121593]
MAPKVHIEVSHLLARNSTYTNSTAASSDKAKQIITDGYLGGDVVISMDDAKDTTETPAEYLVEVIFEGKLSTSIHLNISTQLLRMAKNLILLRASDIRELSQIQSPTTRPPSQTFIHPFHFNIPQTADPTSSNTETSVSLPPSLSLKPLSVYDSNDLTLHGQCRIEYCLKARLFDQSGCIAEDQFPVTFAPAHECPPPVCIGDFPREYTLQSSNRVRDLLSLRDLYYLSVETEEPAPLHLNRLNTAFTIIPLKLRYQCLAPSKHHHHHNQPHTPPDLFAKIRTTLRATTFLSVTSQPRVPIQLEANKLHNFRLLGNTIKIGSTQTRKLRLASWERENTHQLNQDQPVIWASTAHLIFTFDNDDYVPPTFTHPYVSRRYSLLISIDVDGARDVSFQLQVPVHVSYDRGQGGVSSCEEGRVYLGASMDDEDLSGGCVLPPYMA